MSAPSTTCRPRTRAGSDCARSTASPSRRPMGAEWSTGSVIGTRCSHCYFSRCAVSVSWPAGSTRCARRTGLRCPCCPASRSGRRCCPSPKKSPSMREALQAEARGGEVAAMVAVQSVLAERPGVLTAARALSHFGEHSIGWLVVSLLGAVLLPRRRRDWLIAGAGTFAAHAAAVLVKRLVRRQRPQHPAVAVNVGTPSQLSFPSAHATSTTAAAILMGRAVDSKRLKGSPLPVLLVPPMALSRILLGVHYPSDVASGIGLGAAVAGIAVRTREMWRR